MKELKNIILNVSKNASSNRFKVQTEILAELLYYRLVIARLGEEDNNAWWESSILSEVGRRNLNRFLPNTLYKQRYDIARKIIYSKETRTIESRKFVSLYNFGYKFESEVFKPFVDELVINDKWYEILMSLEKIKGFKFKSPWVREFFELDRLPQSNTSNKDSIEIGNIQETFYNDYTEFTSVIKGLLSVYDRCTFGKLLIPYYTRKVAV